ncbi:hypothetical protein OAS01_00020 [Candidatus Pelagibacter sp.]|nr:hypothetical protein [Candidatus Pelagibacter sp.]
MNWKCEASNSLKSKCTRSFDGQSKDNDILGANTLMIYIGKISNSLPNGKGELIFKHTKINSNYERSVQIGLLQKNGKGIFVTDPKNHSTKLVDGYMEYMSGVKEFRKNKKTVKLVFPGGQSFSGKFYLDDEYSYPVLSKGTFEYPNRTDGSVVKFVGDFIFIKIREEKRVDNRFKNGIAYFANGDTFEGSWFYKNSNMIKNGTYNFKNGERFIGEFNEKGKYVKGKFYYKNGDVYQGSFFQSNTSERKTGTYYYADGGKLKINNGKEGDYKPSKEKSSSKKTKSYKEPNFFTSFVLSWVFTGLLWGLIFIYFFFLHQIGKVVRKVPIKGFRDTAFFVGFGLTWYLAWSLLYGFEAAALINFTIILVGIWGAIGVFICNVMLKILPPKNFSNYLLIGFVIFWLILGVDNIDVPIKFLKNIF